MPIWTNIIHVTTGNLLADEYRDDRPLPGDTIEINGRRMRILESRLINPRTYDWSGVIREVFVTEVLD